MYEVLDGPIKNVWCGPPRAAVVFIHPILSGEFVHLSFGFVVVCWRVYASKNRGSVSFTSLYILASAFFLVCSFVILARSISLFRLIAFLSP